MRKILVVLMLVCVLGLFAQIPAGTKSVAVLAGGTGDILDSLGFEYNIDINAGYFIMDALEIDAILSFMGTTVEAPEGVETSVFGVGIGALYHMPLSPMLGLYGGAAFIFSSANYGAEDSQMGVPIDVGIELFLTQNNAVRIANRFTLNLTETMDNTDQIMIGTVHYFQ